MKFQHVKHLDLFVLQTILLVFAHLVKKLLSLSAKLSVNSEHFSAVQIPSLPRSLNPQFVHNFQVSWLPCHVGVMLTVAVAIHVASWPTSRVDLQRAALLVATHACHSSENKPSILTASRSEITVTHSSHQHHNLWELLKRRCLFYFNILVPSALYFFLCTAQTYICSIPAILFQSLYILSLSLFGRQQCFFQIQP